MRSILFIAVAALLTSGNGRAQQKSTTQPTSSTAQPTSGTEGLACFENLAAPEYPKSALQAHVDGSVWTTIHLTPQATLDKIDTQVVSAWGEGPKLLTPPVEKAIRAAKIKSECAGKTVSVVFRYMFYGQASPEPNVTSRTEAPNLMWIESQPGTATGSTSSTSTGP